MASSEAIANAWELMTSYGIKSPFGSDRQRAAGLQAWELALADTADADLVAAVVAWVRSPQVRYGWPQPGVLLDAIGDTAEIDTADQAWGWLLQILRHPARIADPDYPHGKRPESADDLEYMRARLTERRAAAVAEGHLTLARRYDRSLEQLPDPGPRVTAAILDGLKAIGGWGTLERARDEDLIMHRAAFRGAYRAGVERSRISDRRSGALRLISGSTPALEGSSDDP